MKKAFDTVDHNIVLLESEETYLNGLKLIWVHKSVTFSCVFMLMQLNKCVVCGSDLQREHCGDGVSLILFIYERSRGHCSEFGQGTMGCSGKCCFGVMYGEWYGVCCVVGC